MKKKILSVMLACLMIMTACITMIPAATAAATIGAPEASLTADELALKAQGYVAYVTGDNITADTAESFGAVLVDGKYAVPFKWFSNVDTDAANFDSAKILYPNGASSDPKLDTALGWMSVNARKTEGDSTVYYNHKVTLLQDIYTLGWTDKNTSDVTGVNKWITWVGGVVMQNGMDYDGNGFTHTAAGCMVSTSNGCVISNLKLHMKPNKWEVAGADTEINEGFFQARQNSIVTFENCTFIGETTCSNGFDCNNSGKGMTFTNCVIDMKTTSGSKNTNVFQNQGGANGKYTLTNCDIKCAGDSAGYVFHSTGGGHQLNLNITNVNIDTTACTKMSFMEACYNSGTGVSVNITDSNIKVAAEGVVAVNRGIFNLNNTTFTCGGAAFSANKNNMPTREIYISGNTKINAKQLLGALDSGNTPFTVISTTPSFFHDSDDDMDMYVAPVLLDGASVRTNTDSNGLRFTAYTGKYNNASEKGILVTKTANLASTEFTANALAKAEVTSYKEVVATLTTADGDNESFTAALLGIPNVNEAYSARAYAKYSLGNSGTVTTYSAYSAENNSRSLAEVAYRAVNDLKAFNAETGHVCKIEEGKYSPYSADQYAVLKTYSAQYVAPSES